MEIPNLLMFVAMVTLLYQVLRWWKRQFRIYLGSVVVTNSCTEIGKSLIVRLSQRRCRVYAGCQDASEVTKLKGRPNIIPVILDLSNSYSIQDLINSLQWSGNTGSRLGLTLDAVIHIEGDRLAESVDLTGLVQSCIPMMKTSDNPRIAVITETDSFSEHLRVATSQFLSRYKAQADGIAMTHILSGSGPVGYEIEGIVDALYQRWPQTTIYDSWFSAIVDQTRIWTSKVLGLRYRFKPKAHQV